jgi:hypothetical protein
MLTDRLGFRSTEGLDEVKEAVTDLRALTPNSVLVDLVEYRIKMIERQRQYCCRYVG